MWHYELSHGGSQVGRASQQLLDKDVSVVLLTPHFFSDPFLQMTSV